MASSSIIETHKFCKYGSTIAAPLLPLVEDPLIESRADIASAEFTRATAWSGDCSGGTDSSKPEQEAGGGRQPYRSLSRPLSRLPSQPYAMIRFPRPRLDTRMESDR
ncbi:hypothetical protein GCM10017653_16220 [Ancylobacter defluvii]|uniref:Uncharacterized protein n=1 Tax=Ancylobacter defluvii TaxID=1282440 RepID=A0A9W6JVZ2_9HYPH|nr:hypothetical protein GCM10017653_16220 [Ancylobacter defluvii]